MLNVTSERKGNKNNKTKLQRVFFSSNKSFFVFLYLPRAGVVHVQILYTVQNEIKHFKLTAT